jgi:putative metallohydrolase (TIGR04338 family)
MLLLDLVISREKVMPPRDSQKSKLYRAERALARRGSTFQSIDEVRQYVAWVWKFKRIRKLWPHAFPPYWNIGDPQVGDGRGRRKAVGGVWGIKIPVWARTERVVLHELAHVIHMRSQGWDRDEAAHGWQYAAVFLKLVHIVMGGEAAAALKAGFKQEGVRFTKPAKRRPVSAERKAQLTAQLAMARAKRMSNLGRVNVKLAAHVKEGEGS